MKLVIDTPKEVYEYCKHWKANGVANWSECTIADGTPYEEKKGKWINEYVEYMGMKTLVCSECHYPMGQIKDCFCANCGANMRGEENE